MANILVVDDEQDILEMTKIMLTTSNHKVLTTLNGEEALEIVQKEKVDLILLDAVLPGIHGLDICRILKRNKETQRTPIIIFSALGTGVKMMLEDRDRADDFISKPFTRKNLLETIEKVLEKKKIPQKEIKTRGSVVILNASIEIPSHMQSISSE
ncbi:response regulator [archaeon]|nr:response regulator [archaeon]